MSGYWFPAREQDLADHAVIWKEYLSDAAKQTAYGWDAGECAATVSAIDGFLEKRAAYREGKSAAKRLLKDEAERRVKEREHS
ncbi:MAG: hypothetical protein LBB61_02715 [Treponema sp.]|jgi:uncharacterized protein with von Willebrand factor type A (vWA) domain|nr:hypothetical protein [Treponema sp.]